MTKNDDDYSKNGKELSHGGDAKPPRKDQRHEPSFGRYDEDDEYEEPDRDSDYTAGYHADDVDDEEEYEDDFSEDNERDLFEEEDPQNDAEQPDEDEPEAWLEDDEYSEESSGQNWPFGLIAVAIVALVLLAAGGYGVMQQRAATEEELRELRAALSTTSSSQNVSASRDALAELQSAYDTLAEELETLRLENRTLTDTVAGLAGQLGDTQGAPTEAGSSTEQATATKPTSATIQPAQPVVAQPPATPAPPAPKPVAIKPIEAKPAAATPSGRWFVNFGSYATRNMAESWAARLQPGAGKVVILPTSSDGKTLYRLRVIELSDREVARGVARKLETELRVDPLWVGKE
jgi:cell division septation protein DedD